MLAAALAHLELAITRHTKELQSVVEDGRTHLVDAMPIGAFGQELRRLGGDATRCNAVQQRARHRHALERLRALPLGLRRWTTGINAHPELSARRAAMPGEDQTDVPFMVHRSNLLKGKPHRCGG